MPGRIELHYCSDLYHLTDFFLKKYLLPLEDRERILYIVNDSWRVQQLTEEWLLRKSGEVSSEFPFISYSTWLDRLGNQLNIIPRRLNLTERCLQLRSVIDRNHQALQYFHFHGPYFPSDLIRKLILFFDRIRLNEADVEIVPNLENRLILNSVDRLQFDLNLLFSSYLALQRDRFLDEAGLLAEIIRLYSTEFLKKYYPRLTTIVFEDISHFQKMHIRFLEHLKMRGIHMILLLPYGRNPEIFSHKNSLITRIKSIADHYEWYPGVDKLSNSLFQIKSPQFNFAEKVQIIPAAHRLQEVENLAAQIKKYVVDNDWSYSTIGITSPQLPQYYSILEMIFSRYRIPFSFSVDRPLEQSVVIQNLGWLIELVKENYPRKILHHILQSPLFSYREKLSDQGILGLIPTFRVKAGKKEILEFLSRQIRLQELSINPENGEETIQLPFQEIKNIVEELFTEVSFFEKPQTAASIYRHLIQIVKQYKFFEKILAHSRTGFSRWWLDNHSSLNRFFELLQFWKETESQLRPSIKYPVQDFWEIFSSMIQLSTSHSRLPSKQAVQVVSINQIAGQKFKALFVIGMEEGIFPSGKSLNFIQLQSMPANLQNYAFDELVYWERESFLKLLQHPAEVVQFSYSRFQQERPVLPSFFLNELERISNRPLQTKHHLKIYTPSSLLDKLLENQKDFTADFQKGHIPDFIGDFLTARMIQHFDHSQQVTRHREQLSAPSEWEGMLSTDPAAMNWLIRNHQNKPFSPTQLESYAKCPMIYFFDKILKLQPYEEGDEFFTALDRGSILHHILFQFYRKNSPKNRHLESLTAIGREQLEKLKITDSLLWELEKEYFLGNEQRKGLLPAFWEYEQRTASTYKTIPQHFEISLGKVPENSDNIDPLSSPQPFLYHRDQEQYLFNGKIDRVEIADNGALLIVDYKSGILPNFQEMWKGEKLQLPIYLKMVFELLKNHYPNLYLTGGAFYSLRKENDIEKKLVFAHQNTSEITTAEIKTVSFPNEKFLVNNRSLTLEQFIDYIFDFAVNYINHIRQGKFPHTVDQSKCKRWDAKWCEYFPLCRVNWYKTSFLGRNQILPESG
ncbi:MAG: hypothetical protein A2Y94_06685 [Caldithrix sp. RBG_13_44_9]|nr:MAG: hypothetical protein A2Y94_06685 [Caldithrix sp. RBG_13_44_9]